MEMILQGGDSSFSAHFLVKEEEKLSINIPFFFTRFS